MSVPADPFMIRAHVPDWEGSVADYRAASASTRERLRSRLNVAYGDHPAETLDLFFPGGPGDAALPVHLFIHGGYWRAFSKEDYSFVADAVTAAGAIAAMVDYSLMPGARMATLVDQVRQAALWVARNAATFGGDPGAVSASGHSAGAHLASYLVRRAADEAPTRQAEIRSVLLVSGIYDLGPITRSFLQEEIRLTDEEVERWSPLTSNLFQDAGITIAVGRQETEPFLEQADAYAAVLAGEVSKARSVRMDGEDHMSIVRSLGRPGSAVAALLAATIRSSRPL